METMATALVVTSLLFSFTPGAWADARIAQAPGTTTEKPASGSQPGMGGMTAVEVRGTVAAVDKKASTVTLKGPMGRTITLEVRDKQKLDAIKAGDPVVATYVEALAFRIQPPGKATPDIKIQESVVGSKPGETPGGAVGRQVTAVVTITAIDKAAPSVTVKGPRGGTETIKVRDPKNLEAIKVGDRVEITYTQALAVALDKHAK